MNRGLEKAVHLLKKSHEHTFPHVIWSGGWTIDGEREKSPQTKSEQTQKKKKVVFIDCVHIQGHLLRGTVHICPHISCCHARTKWEKKQRYGCKRLIWHSTSVQVQYKLKQLSSRANRQFRFPMFCFLSPLNKFVPLSSKLLVIYAHDLVS